MAGRSVWTCLYDLRGGTWQASGAAGGGKEVGIPELEGE